MSSENGTRTPPHRPRSWNRHECRGLVPEALAAEKRTDTYCLSFLSAVLAHHSAAAQGAGMSYLAHAHAKGQAVLHCARRATAAALATASGNKPACHDCCTPRVTRLPAPSGYTRRLSLRSFHRPSGLPQAGVHLGGGPRGMPPFARELAA